MRKTRHDRRCDEIVKKLDDDQRGYVLDLLHAVDQAHSILLFKDSPTEWREQAADLLKRRAQSVKDALGVKASASKRGRKP